MYVKCIRQQPSATEIVETSFETAVDEESGISRVIKKSKSTLVPPFEVGAPYPVYAILVRNNGAIKYVLSGEPFDESHSSRWLGLADGNDFEVIEGNIPDDWSWQTYLGKDYRAGMSPCEWGQLLDFLAALQINDGAARKSFLATRMQMSQLA